MTEVSVDKDLCIGCGACASIAPENFTMDTDGLSKVVKTPAPIEEVETAAESCPTSAIKLTNIDDEN